MAVISETEKDKLVELFEERGVNFYHACQWVDFKSYCALSGLPSRGLMETGNHGFTKFDTDRRDKQNAVWNLVFGNLIDSGRPFAKGGNYNNLVATPNVFGPILLIFKPSVFDLADDVAIALRSAGGKNFNRDKESLSSVEEVNKIFLYEDINEVNYDLEKSYIKFHGELKEIFADRVCGNPEVSCSVKNELIPFEYLHEIIVDDIVVGKNTLQLHVKKILRDNGIDCPVRIRQYAEGRKELLSDLVNGILRLEESKESEEVEKKEAEAEAKTNVDIWIERILANDKKFQFLRFLDYFKNGTIDQLKFEDEIDPFDFFKRPPFNL